MGNYISRSSSGTSVCLNCLRSGYHVPGCMVRDDTLPEVPQIIVEPRERVNGVPLWMTTLTACTFVLGLVAWLMLAYHDELVNWLLTVPK